MFKIKHKSTKAIAFLIFGLLFVSFFSSANIFNPPNEQGEDIVELDGLYDPDQSVNDEDVDKIDEPTFLDYYDEEKTETTYDRNAIDWKPV
ncbi:MAG: hypothetical protein ACXABG_09235, partial [Promethearchaeota archaeon]